MTMETKANNGTGLKAHYYGDEVRVLFLIGAFIMIAALPFIHDFIGWPIVFSIVAILVLTVAAGFTNPKHFSMAAFNVLIALVAVIVFEFYAIGTYNALGAPDLFFWLNQILAVDFLIALYFGVKTLRGKLA